MKRFLLFLLISISGTAVMAQQSVGIGTATPNNSAVLDLTSTSKGLLIPRMTGAQRTAIASPATGLLVFQTNTVITIPTSSPGFYMYDGTAWKLIAKDEDIVPPGSSSTWTLSGNNQFSAVTGNVGIGDNTPTEKLDLLGNLKIANGSSGAKLRMTGGASPFFTSSIEFNDNVNANLAKINCLAGILQFGVTGYADHLSLMPDGTMLGGTGVTLSLNGTGNSSPTVLLNDEIPSIYFRQGGADKGYVRVIGNDMYVETANGNTTGAFGVRMNNSTKFNIDPNGNVGIGTIAPSEKLEVVGNAILNATSATLSLQAGSVDKGFVQLSGDNLRLGTFSSNTNGRIILRSGGADQLTVTENGEVCIGTSTPTAKFTVAGQTVINNGTSNALNIVGKFNVTKDAEAIHINGVDAAINFFNGAQQRGYLWNTGNDMQIGASQSGGRLLLNATKIEMGLNNVLPDGYKLGVGGKVLCEELKVKLQSSTWPDYVFHKDYKLPSLSEVEKYIDVNQHLPNIPSAAEVEKNGIEVGDMQKRLMEKVEELTLYVIELQKQIEILKASIKK